MSKQVACCLLTLLGMLAALGGAAWLAWQPKGCVDPAALSPSLPALHSQQNSQTLPRPSLGSASTLVQQARCFGLYLNASPAPATRAPNETKPPANRFKLGMTASVPATRPHTVSPRFQVMAISVYPSRPEKSMALISEPGSGTRWVKCCEDVGHLTIEAIHRQHVVWRNGEQTGRVVVTTESAREGPATAGHAPALQPRMYPKPLAQKQRHTILSPRIKSKPTARGLNPER